MKAYKLIFIVVVLMITMNAHTSSTLADFTFTDSKQTQDFRNLTEQLRCLVCQNESLAASQAELAQDLRREIYAMMKAGKTQEEVITFLVARYGDFILYNPPIKPSTYFLWYGPFIFFSIGGLLFARTLLKQKYIPETTAALENVATVTDVKLPLDTNL